MMTLYGYWRSSASYRVRIAFALKGVEVHQKYVNLKLREQLTGAHAELNPQKYVPVLELEDGTRLTQSLAIMSYLDESFPEPSLMPKDQVLRAKILSASLTIASDIAPIANLSVLNYLRSEYGHDEIKVKDWIVHWIMEGFTALETIAQGFNTPFFMTEFPTFFECCLIPQIYNAKRFGMDLAVYPRLSAINATCLALPAFQSALPENQKDSL